MKTMEHVNCGRCGRELKTEKSRKDGFGPVCKAKVEATKALAASRQQEADVNNDIDK